jgi:predicted nucleotidyltransferase component of viral defense system
MPADDAALAHRARLATLDAVHSSPLLSGRYVLKGGLVLHHVYGSPRPSEDLDFNAAEPVENEVSEGKEHRLIRVAAALDDALHESAPRFGLAAMTVQKKTLSDVLPTLLAEVGYTTDADAAPPFTRSVEMQVTLSEIVCETREAEIEGVQVLVPTLDDIAADKLKVLLQNATRAVVRPNDTWDLWWIRTHAGTPLDVARVADFLREKCHVWDRICNPTAANFHADAVRAKAAAGYAALARTGLRPYPSFEEAWGTVLKFVDALKL